MIKIDKKLILDIHDELLDDNVYFDYHKKYVIDGEGEEMAVNKEEGINLIFEKDNTISFWEKYDNIAYIDLNDMSVRKYEKNNFWAVDFDDRDVKNYDNKKWQVKLVNNEDGNIEIQLWNKPKNDYMIWAIEKDGDDFNILYEMGNENVFNNPKWRFDFANETYWDYEKKELFKIKELFKDGNVKSPLLRVFI